MLVYADPLIVDNFEFKRNLNAANQILWTDETKAVLNVAKLLYERIKNSFHWTAMAIRGEESMLRVADSRNC